jgi:putative intracellular protease/amidase
MTGTPRILIVTTSNDLLGDTGAETGFHWVEMTDPYWAFRDAGYEVDLASIIGGRPPADPSSLADDPADRPASVRRFQDDTAAMAQLEATIPVAEVEADAYDAVYLPGGHGTMWDLPLNGALGDLLMRMDAQDRVVAGICHGPAGFVGVTRPDGQPLVHGRRINCFTDAEERKVGKDGIVPFLLESRLRQEGAEVEHADPFEACCVVDGNLVTGQNPASTEPLARAVIDAVEARRQRRAAE